MKTRPAIIVTFLLLAACVAGRAPAATLIASYSLDNTPIDATGNYGDAELVNVLYEEGGVYCNGVYSGEEASQVSTPSLSALTTTSFSMTVQFKIGELPSTTFPVIVGGASWRWIGAVVDWNGHLQLMYNSTTPYSSDTSVSIDEWHTIVITYDGTTGVLYMDGQFVASREFALVDGDDRHVGITNGGNGTTFKGHLRNLNVYNGVLTGIPVSSSSMTAIKTQYRP